MFHCSDSVSTSPEICAQAGRRTLLVRGADYEHAMVVAATTTSP
jgi:hypothetical protein